MADLQVELGEGAGNFTKEKWAEMMKLLDKDGDRTVDKEEYETVYRAMFPGISDEDFAAVWAKIDSDGNGSLDMTELAAYAQSRVGDFGGDDRRADPGGATDAGSSDSDE